MFPFGLTNPGFAANAKPRADLFAGLVSYFKCDDLTGSQTDELGATFFAGGIGDGAPGKINQALKAEDGDEVFLGEGTTASWGNMGVDFTFVLWLKPGASVAGNIFGTVWDGEGYSAPGYQLYFDGTVYKFRINGEEKTITIGTPTGGFDLVIFWVDIAANTMNSQFNNGAVTSLSLASTTVGEGSFILGDGPADTFAMYIDEWAFYQGRVLRRVDRTAFWNSGAGTSYPFS